MQKKSVTAILFLVLLLSACNGMGVPFNAVKGSGSVASEDRAVQGIRAVALAAPGDLEITLGDQETLRIEAEENLLPYIETIVEDGVLTIREKNDSTLLPTRPIRCYLTVTGLDSLAVSSSGNITAPTLAADHFSVSINSSGNITLAGIEGQTLEVQINSSGNLEIGGGKVDQQDISINSSGSYRAEDLESWEATVHLNSSGSATLWVRKRIDASLSSSGNLYYYGDPLVMAETTSSGTAISQGEK